jgi:two-component system, OmpR family, sensor kinase
MRTVSLRLRVVLATLIVLALSLAGFAVAVTLHYRDGLERDLRNRLTAGGLALQRTSPTDLKQLMSSLALEGIDVNLGDLRQPVTKPGSGRHLQPSGASVPATRPVTHPSITSRGNLLVIKVPVGVSDPKLKRLLSPRPDVAISTASLTASQSSVDTPVHQLIVVEGVAGLIVITLAGVLLLLGLRTALSPLARVAGVAARIAAGDRGQRLNPDRRDTELGRMAASFDEMVSALAASVERSNRSEAAMRRFLAAASHELRTPIAALHATIETLLREQPPRPERDGLEV